MKYVVFYILMLTKLETLNCMVLEETAIAYKDCLLDIIRHNFKKDETLCFVSNNNFDGFALITHPYIVIKTDTQIFLQWKYCRNFIFLANDEQSLDHILRTSVGSNIWNLQLSKKGKFLIITHSREVSKIFKTLWDNVIIDAIVLVPDCARNHTIYMSNPFQDGNDCGINASIIFNQPCSAALVPLFKLPLTDLAGCPIIFKNLERHFTPIRNTVRFVLTELAKSLNSTIKLYNTQEGLPPIPIVLDFFFSDVHLPFLETSRTIYRQDWVWITPKPLRIFPADTIIVLFKFEVWILTGFMFIFAIIIWSLINTLRKVTDKFSELCHAFINITSLTLCGTLSLIPKWKLLRYVFLVYSLYVLIIQTAFKTNLVHVLTFPEYIGIIGSAKEVIELKLPVYLMSFFIATILRHNYSNATDYDKLKILLVPTQFHDNFFNLTYSYRNSAILMPIVFYDLYKKHMKLNFQTFIDNRVTGEIQMSFVTMIGHFFIENLNKLLCPVEETLESTYFQRRSHQQEESPEERDAMNRIRIVNCNFTVIKNSGIAQVGNLITVPQLANECDYQTKPQKDAEKARIRTKLFERLVLKVDFAKQGMGSSKDGCNV
ncbi:hypothetical protein FQA39_LY08126 [Lamprigera yunnana]|nr:hypothetical protein FQA39_LY08126 [Lamprigera yunnana]